MPFYVAAPMTTIDLACPDGAAIPIEERPGSRGHCTFAGQADRARRRLRPLRRLRRHAGAVRDGDRHGPGHLPRALRGEPRAPRPAGPGPHEPRPRHRDLLRRDVGRRPRRRRARVLSNVVSSQMRAHAPYGGVVPEIAARAHLENICRRFSRQRPDARRRAARGRSALVAATAGPGLIGALLVGLSAAQGARVRARRAPRRRQSPRGHISSRPSCARGRAAAAPPLPVPRARRLGRPRGARPRARRIAIVPLARTRDDAPGEAFDKVARRAGLGYPGGPVVDRIAARGRGDRHPFPIGRAGDGSRDFSFSGLKTAMLRELEKRGVDGSPLDPESLDPELVDLLASFQHAIVSALLDRVESVHADEGIRASRSRAASPRTRSCASTLAAWGREHGVPVLPPRPLAHDRQRRDDRLGGPASVRVREAATDPAAAAARSRWPPG